MIFFLFFSCKDNQLEKNDDDFKSEDLSPGKAESKQILLLVREVAIAKLLQLVLQDRSGNCLWLATKPLVLEQMLAY